MGQITHAYNGTYPSLLSMENFNPFTSACAYLDGQKGWHVGHVSLRADA